MIIIFNAHLEMKLPNGRSHIIDGIVTEYSIECLQGYREITVTIKESELPNNLMHHLMHPRVDTIPYSKIEDESMSVKIRKQPKEISLEEFKKCEEFEEVRIYMDNDKKEEIENKYGISYDYASKLFLSDDEIIFKENYLVTKYDNVPYEIINKIEVVEK